MERPGGEQLEAKEEENRARTSATWNVLVASSFRQRRNRIRKGNLAPVTAEEGFLPLLAFLLAVSLGGGGLVGNREEERRLAMGLVLSMKD